MTKKILILLLLAGLCLGATLPALAATRPQALRQTALRSVVHPRRGPCQWLRQMEELNQSDPAACTQELLRRHEQMVKKATEVVRKKDTLPQEILTSLERRQAEALQRFEERLRREETDEETIARKLERFRAKQAEKKAAVQQNVDEIAARMLQRARKILEEEDQVRARIEAGQGLELLKERLRQTRQQEKERRPEQRQRRNR